MKALIRTNQALQPIAPLDAETDFVSPSSDRSARTHEERGPQAMHRALRRAVHAYAHDPSKRNALMVEAVIAELRGHRANASLRG